MQGREEYRWYPYFITCREAAGEAVELRCKVQATLHWVSAADAVSAEVRLYNQLFTRADPNVAEFAADLNPGSLEVLAGCRVEPAAAGDNSAEPVQFERQGYFCRDADSKPGRPVFNRTVGLRDTWAKVSGGGGKAGCAARATIFVLSGLSSACWDWRHSRR